MRSDRNAIPRRVAATAAIVALGLSTPGGAQDASPAPAATPAVHASAHRTITTRSSAAQQAYDRGLLLLYAFNMGASREAFARAAVLDPRCAMARFGEALTEITDINVSTDEAGLARGRTDVALAEKAPEASPDERALIAAIALRFGPAGASGQDAEKTAYENAMRAFATNRPADVDASVEAAFAIWQAESDIRSKASAEIGALLDRALAADPDDFGAHHLRIHYEEETGKPADALSDADFLFHATYDPGESHLPHMAGHIYSRVGDFDRMVASNQIAIANDEAYFAGPTGPGVDYMRFYHDHDVDFVLYGLSTLGRDDDARAAAKREDAYARVRLALRLHDWTAVLRETKNSYQAAIAEARLGRSSEAAAALAPAKGQPALPAAQQAMIRGALARASGDPAAAVTAYAAAYAARSGDLGDPKTSWATPVGEAYAAALLRAGRAADAKRIFTDELARYPNDPRLLFGRAYASEALHEDGSGDRAAAASHWHAAAPPAPNDLG